METVGTLRRLSAPMAWLLALAALLAPPAASAQDAGEPAQPIFTPAEASAQLDQAVEALSATDPAAAHPTDELRDLTAALLSARTAAERAPSSHDRRRTRQGNEPFGAEWRGRERDDPRSANFIVHWPDLPCSAPSQGCDEPDLTDLSGSPAPDYIDQVADAAEESFDVENGALGWPAPKPDGSRGGNEKIDVYVADICDETNGACIFGYANTDDPSTSAGSLPFRCFAYLVLDNDYNVGEFGYDDPGVPLRVTTAHEYNHILQFRLDTRQDGWMFESTAVWSEEQVFPNDDDWLAYLDVWTRTSRKPITSFNAGGGLRVYGSGVWNHWLHLGAGAGPRWSWTHGRARARRTRRPSRWRRTIARSAGTGGTASQEFGRFAAATAEWRVLDGNFPGADANQPDEAQFPDVQRRESCVRAARRTGSASTTRRSGSFESSRARPTIWSCG